MLQHNLKPIPDIEANFKPLFVERLSAMTDFEEFKKYSLSYLLRSIRVNTLKTSIANVKKTLGKTWILEQIPWCKEGFWISHPEGRRDIGNTIEHAMGHIYVQEAASMIPPLLLDPKPGSIVLDMCAAPGSKTTQIAQMMENKGVLIANDFKGDRLASLGINLNRCGVSNNVVTLMRGTSFARKNLQCDYVLVDAPCSGSGTIRKSLKTIRIWNHNMIKKLANEQKRLIQAGFDVLKPGGTLVYSTCSIEPEENEAVISHLLENNPNAKIVKSGLKALMTTPAVMEWGGMNFHKEVTHMLRLFPQDNDTEGFCVGKIIKSKE